MKKLEKFLQLFSEFNLVVTKPGTYKTKVLENKEIIEPAISNLKKSIRKLEKEYNAAKKAFKSGRIPREELFDYEWRLFELKEELRKIEGGEAF